MLMDNEIMMKMLRKNTFDQLKLIWLTSFKSNSYIECTPRLVYKRSVSLQQLQYLHFYSYPHFLTEMVVFSSMVLRAFRFC